jgi:hypothetical protein
MILENILFVATLLFPWAIVIANICLFRGKFKLVAVLLSVVLVYAALLLQVHLVDARLERELYAFDLNSDGVFSGTEITAAQEAAMAALVNDTGRALAPISGAIFSFLYTGISFIICYLAARLWSKFRANRV